MNGKNKTMKYIMKKCKALLAKLTKWKSENKLNGENWLDNFESIYKVTFLQYLFQTENLTDYQFQIRDIFTNNKLYKMEQADIEMCYLCHPEIETSLIYRNCHKYI